MEPVDNCEKYVIAARTQPGQMTSQKSNKTRIVFDVREPFKNNIFVVFMEKENNTLLALIAVLLFSTVGLVVKEFLNNSLTNMTQTGIIGDILNFIKSPGLFDGLLWLIVCIVIYFGTGYAFAQNQKTGPISLTFFLLWIFTIIGLIVGEILWSLFEGKNVILNLDLFVALMASSMSLSLGPAFAAALGISNKE